MELTEQIDCCAPLTAAPIDDAAAAELARTYAALADPVRLKMLSLIAASGEVCSCDFVEPLAKSQPTVSHHTRILAEAGLIDGDKRGRWVHWRVRSGREGFVRGVLGAGPA
ncbi:MAG: metalloregulator ArsR/SmtB family transcription factor [Ilumatobacter sp.]|uniref:ArsR/SmtB family transcription factor n=1 Tax=Ilumatobacter sp. TaxID=1967498 RepID=UPI0032969845